MANRPLGITQNLINFLGAILHILAHHIHIELPCKYQYFLINIDRPHSFQKSTLLHISLLLEVFDLADKLGWVRQKYMFICSSWWLAQFNLSKLWLPWGAPKFLQERGGPIISQESWLMMQYVEWKHSGEEANQPLQAKDRKAYRKRLKLRE